MKYSEFKEAKSHGTPDFPVEYYHVIEGASNYVMQLHWHEELEVVRVLRGELLLFVNNEQRLLQKGDIAFIGSGMLHRAEPHSSDYECLVFSPSFLKKYSYGKISAHLSPLISGDADADFSAPPPRIISAVGALLDASHCEDEFREMKITATLAALIYELHSAGLIKPRRKNALSKHQTRTMTTLIDWIEKNYAEKITLDAMAEVCGLTPKYLCAFFKKMTGYAPSEYVNRLRIEKACLMLSDGHSSITDAAFDNGFGELSYFSKLFRRYVGCTPSEYKKKGAL